MGYFASKHWHSTHDHTIWMTCRESCFRFGLLNCRFLRGTISTMLGRSGLPTLAGIEAGSLEAGWLGIAVCSKCWTYGEGHRRSSGMGGMVVSLHRLQYHHYHPKKFMQKMSMEADHIILKLVRLVRLRWFQVLDTSNMKQEFLEHWPVKDHVSPELLQSPAASFASGIPRPSLSSSYAMQHQHWHGLRNPTSQLFLSLPRLAMC